MKNYIILVGLCVATVGCRRGAKSDCEKLNLQGGVSCIVESYYSFAVAADGALMKDRRTESETWLFDSGDQTFLLSYETRICFDAKGRKKVVEVSDSAALNLEAREVYEYDDEGNLVAKRGFSFDSMYYRETFAYDKKRREIERVFYDLDGEEVETIRSEYVGNAVRSLVLPADPDADTLEILATVDADGNRTDERLQTAAGELLKRDAKIFDAKGRMVELTSYDRAQSPYQRSTCRYDERGNEAEFIIYNLENNEVIATYRYHYIYDARGNWIEQVCMMNDAPYVLTAREISYF